MRMRQSVSTLAQGLWKALARNSSAEIGICLIAYSF
jgi:hypothetical protein